ncbi:MAG: hypothetical protein JXA33_26645 [Anaerolineae bacterium]|nr:hypothetical protein [Anaerolineae bacterium]
MKQRKLLTSNTEALGELKRSFHVSRTNLKIFLYGIPFVALMGSFLVVIGARSMHVREQIIFVGGGLLIILAAIILYLAYRVQLGTRVDLYRGGFLYVDWRKRQYVCRWEDVREIYEFVSDEEREDHTGIWSYEVVLVNRRRFRLTMALDEVRVLGQSLLGELARQQLAQVLDRYHAGEEIAFGSHVALHKTGIICGKDHLAWHEVAEIEFGELGIQIRQKDSLRPWKTIPRERVANLTLFKGVADMILHPQQTPFLTLQSLRRVPTVGR